MVKHYSQALHPDGKLWRVLYELRWVPRLVLVGVLVWIGVMALDREPPFRLLGYWTNQPKAGGTLDSTYGPKIGAGWYYDYYANAPVAGSMSGIGEGVASEPAAIVPDSDEPIPVSQRLEAETIRRQFAAFLQMPAISRDRDRSKREAQEIRSARRGVEG